MKRRAMIEWCDNPNCRHQEVSTKDEPATGYHLGKGLINHGGGGGTIPAIYAHTLECIAPAVQHAIEESNR